MFLRKLRWNTFGAFYKKLGDVTVYSEVMQCRLCQSKNLEMVLDLGEQYVVDFVPKVDESLLKAPLQLMRCGICSLVQLKHSVNPERLFRRFWYRSNTNEQMKLALEQIVERAQEVAAVTAADKVLDIGSNDGTLLGWYPGAVTTVGVDPCAELVEESLTAHRVDIGLKGFFSAELVAPYGPYKVITAISMFYDVEDPIRFLLQCQEVLREDGVLIIQMNYLPVMLKNCAVDNICHEHLGYYSMHTLQHAAKMADLEIVGAELNDVNGGSVRVYMTKHTNLYGMSSSSQLNIFMTAMNLLHQESLSGLDKPQIYLEFRNAVQSKLSAITSYIDHELIKRAKIYLYGASTRGTVLMQLLNLSDGMVMGVAERDYNKYNLHMVGGTWPKIYPEDYVRKDATHMLVLPWHFEESITRREKDWLQRGGKMIIPLPEPKVVSVSGVEYIIGKTVKIEAAR